VRILLAALLLGIMPATAGVSIRKQGANRVVKTEAYEAVVEADGCLTHLRVGGTEFLAAGVSISRGSYLALRGVVRFPRVRTTGRATIVVQSKAASIRYRFGDQEMEWKIRNTARAVMRLFLVFDPGLDAVIDPKGEFARPVVEGDWNHAVWLREGARLEIEGGTRQWGPWVGNHQVWELLIPAGKERTVHFRMGPATGDERAGVAKLLDPFGGRDLVLFSPRRYQVFQRRTAKKGEVLVSGRLREPAEAVEGRIPEVAPDWIALRLGPGGRSFSKRISLPAGGWYGLELRVRRKGKWEVVEGVDAFGVGEVFVGAGQSNSTNSGQFPTKQKSGLVSSFNGRAWRLADDPQWGTHDKSRGGSFWPAFGDAMVARFHVPIGVAVTGHGGTSVNRWRSDGELFGFMMRRIHQLGPQGFRALLWHQGESDVRMPSELYYRKLKRIIEQSKVQAGWDFPWFVAQATYHNAQNPRYETIRSAQARLWRDGVAMQGPDTDTLGPEFRDRDGKGIHFSPKGLEAHGKLWAQAVGDYLEALLGGE